MGVDMSNNNPPFFPSPALSLSLAGIFRQGAEAEGGDEGSGSTRRREEMVEISSENSGHGRSRSEDDVIHSGEYEEEEFDEGGDEEKGTGKKRKKYHRHTAQQIREMEALFKESPHPDEKQRQQLSKQLGLHPRQVKFWFQNRRTQIKAIQERHENNVLKSELERIKEENKSLREVIQKSCCPSCGFGAITNRDITVASTTDDQQLIIENARLKAEVEKLKAIIGKKNTHGTSCPQEEATNDEEKRSSIDQCTGVVGVEKSKIMEVVEKALEELKKMAFLGEPLWVKSVESRREILNYDEYIKEFNVKGSSATTSSPRWSIEASRDSRVVFVDVSKLLQCFMDVSQWKEMFPCLISKAAMMDVISVGEGPNKNNAVQLMYAELQMLTPLVPTREVCFVRYCKQLSSDQWAIVDVSIDQEEDSSGTSLMKYRKRPSGCIIEDKSNGHCKITWVEHLECQKVPVHSLYRSIVNSGIAFGARHWMSTLQLQCERLVFFMATNIPTKDSSGVATLAGRKSILKLAQRMTWRFCWAIGASSLNSWTKFTTKTGEDVRVSSRHNLNDPSEPIGTIMCAVSSIWLPVSPGVLFDFLRDDTQRHKWDIMANGGQVRSIAYLAKGQDRGNAVSVQTMTSKDNIQLLQDSCTNDYESMVVYAHVDVSAMQSVMTGCDSSNVAVLPSGFSILPDGVESRPLVLMSRQEDNKNGGGSLLTIALQTVTNRSPAMMSSVESVESVSCLISCILANIRTCLQCEDG